jgi:PleD family two-component response regulator
VKIEGVEYFDLSALLKQGDLNIRRFVMAESSISADEYFGMLSRLLKLVPNVSSALIKFSNLDGDKDAYKILNNLITLLEKLRCDKLSLDFHSILDTYGKKGNWRASAIHAKQVIEGFDKFHSAIMATKGMKKSDALSHKDLVAQNKTHLKELIKYLDDEEEANRKPLILAVDDSPVVLDTISSVLADTYKVFVLPKPLMLEKVLQKLTPDLFLLDYQMPELDGFKLVPIIRNFEKHKKTPIIFLTSLGTVANISTALALGACDFMVKPFQSNILREKIAKHIVKK